MAFSVSFAGLVICRMPHRHRRLRHIYGRRPGSSGPATGQVTPEPGLCACRTAAPRGTPPGGSDGLAIPVGIDRRDRCLGAHPSIPAAGPRTPVVQFMGRLGVVLRNLFSAAGGLFHAYYLVVMAPALSALAGIGLVALWSLDAAGGAASLVLPANLIAAALWQGT